MRISRILAAGMAAMIVGAPGLALADRTLTLVIGGEGFDGPPRFAVSFDGKPVGEGTVDAAIDTRAAGRFADAPSQARYVQKFTFAVPDAVFRKDGVVGISLTNAARGAPGSKDDRELFLMAVSLDGVTLPAAALSMRSAAGIEPTAMLGDYLVIADDAVEAVAVPSAGWGSGVADAAPATPAAAAPGPAASSQTATSPAGEDPIKTGAVAATGTAAAPADANPDPEGGVPQCGLNQKFQVTGFTRNSNELTATARKGLDAVVKAIGTQQCVVHLTGYSSTEGDVAHNALFSIERSQKALYYLAGHGVKFRRYSANGVGETTQFGPSPDANRRVVVAVSP